MFEMPSCNCFSIACACWLFLEWSVDINKPACIPYPVNMLDTGYAAIRHKSTIPLLLFLFRHISQRSEASPQGRLQRESEYSLNCMVVVESSSSLKFVFVEVNLEIRTLSWPAVQSYTLINRVRSQESVGLHLYFSSLR